MKTKMRIASLLVVAFIVPILAISGALARVDASEHHMKVALAPVGGSGVSGFVNLEQKPGGGTHIQVHAKGLQPGGEYVSLYYDNSTCTLPGDDLADYTANSNGVATATGDADDDLDEVDSVSVRVASTLELVACAAVNP